MVFLAVLCLGFPVAAASPAGAPDEAAALVAHEREFRLVPPGRTVLRLMHGFLVAGSVEVFVDGVRWEEGRDYDVAGRSGRISPLRDWNRPRQAPPDSTSARADPRALVIIRYDFLPAGVPARQDLRPLTTAPPTPPATGPQLAVGTRAQDGTAGDEGRLTVRGSKSVQVSSGSRREMTVDQNLRLNIMGNLTREISVRAFLTDDNLPVVPEGNTEELRDIDKVLVELKAPKWQATLGDFVARRAGTAFGDYRRKLQGISLQAEPGPAGVEILAGSPRGRYRTLQVRGQETNQGPYYLGSGSAGDNLFIVAGSERVTLDGEVLTRGSDRDYVIDYVRGTVTFTYRRLITAESDIVVEFEEGEGPYTRTVLGGGASVQGQVPGLGVGGGFSARVIRERDDPGRLRTGELAAEDEGILATAGDDELAAVASGIVAVEAGAGDYDESEVEGKTIYIHDPAGGDFEVAFFYAGVGGGDYDLDHIAESGRRIYVHRGDGLGSYRIGRPLALPAAHSVATMLGSLGDTAGSYLGAEWNVSRVDGNLVSQRDDGDNAGNAGRFFGRLHRQDLAWGGRSLGRLDLSAYHERRDDRFQAFQLRKNVFHYDAWGLAARSRGEGFLAESDRETGAAAGWSVGGQARGLTLGGQLGVLDHGASVEADRRSGSAEWTFAGGRGVHREESAGARDEIDPLDVRHRRSRHEIGWRVLGVRPSVRYGLQRWRDGAAVGSGVAGYRLQEVGYGLASAGGGGIGWRADFTRGLADSLAAGIWRRERDSRTYQSGLTTGQMAGMRLQAEGTLRRILQPAGPDQSTRLARLTLAGKWQKTASDWSLGYRVDNSRTEVLTRQIVFVGANQGDYTQDGDYVGPEQGDHDVVTAGTDSLVATTAVQADLRWRQGFGFLGRDRWFGAWSSLTQATVTGRSTTDDVAGLLTLDPAVLFDEEAAVLGDLNFTQELDLLQHLKRVGLRGRFAFRETRDRQFADRPEDRIARGVTLNSSVNLTRRVSVKLRWLREDDRRTSSESLVSTRRSFRTLTHTSELGTAYRPSSDLRLALQGEYITRRDEVSGVGQREYAVRPETRLRLDRRWTLLGDLRVAEVETREDGSATRPWFFPQPGRNVESSVRLSWEPNDNLTVSASWFTRKQGERSWEHDVRLESTARF